MPNGSSTWTGPGLARACAAAATFSPRYVRKRVKVASSKYVPKAGSETPVPSWKRIDLIQDALPAKDQGKADALGGVITVDEYAAKIASGDA
ncbi:MAG: hypothetical protein R3E87_10500 [Burkholderiaceae bacterium]